MRYFPHKVIYTLANLNKQPSLEFYTALMNIIVFSYLIQRL